MGQQQLLLLVLGIVIVGLAVVVGIQAFGENQKKANADALTNDAIRIASDAQAWALKPAAFGGGEGDFHVGTATSGAPVGLTHLGYELTSSAYSNINGKFKLNVTGTSAANITACNDARDNLVTVTLTGVNANDISTTANSSYTSACP